MHFGGSTGAHPAASRGYFSFTGSAGRLGHIVGLAFSCFISSDTARSNWGSWPSMTDWGSFSTTISGSTPCPSMIHCACQVGEAELRDVRRFRRRAAGRGP